MFKLPFLFFAKRCIACSGIKHSAGRVLASEGLLMSSAIAMSKRFMAVCGGDCPVKSDLCKQFRKRKPKKQKQKKHIKQKSKFKSMWENPECCIEKCVLPKRYDELHYLPTPKGARKYKKTWISCPSQIKPKVQCDIKYVCEDIVLRDPLCKPDTAKPKDLEKFALSRSVKCPKIRLRGCRKAREPPQCQRHRDPSNCSKVKCPTKSYSECLHWPSKKRRTIECQCLVIDSCLPPH